MPMKNGVYIMECVPEVEQKEGASLYLFLDMLLPNQIEYNPIADKEDFINTLTKNKSKFVHISCHGGADDDGNFCMIMPNKEAVYPSDLYSDDRLSGRNVMITGCNLGLAGFAKEFVANTNAKSLIAPIYLIDFADSLMWCVNFYYHLFTRRSLSFDKSYTYMMDHKDVFYVPGGMKYWIRGEK